MKHYTEGQFITFVEKVFGEGKFDGRKNNLQFVCPFCKNVKGEDYSKRKLSIRTTKPHFCHCWVCGYKNRNIYSLLAKWAPHHIPEYKFSFFDAEELTSASSGIVEKYKPVALPEGFTMLAALPYLHNKNSYQKQYYSAAFAYLKNRGIFTKSDLWYWKFGVTTIWREGCKNRIIIPSFNTVGDLTYWTGRTWRRRESKKYNNPFCDRKSVVFNELNIDWEIPLTIVEGPFDLIKCNPNATCMLGSELTLEYELLQKIVKNRTSVVLAFDPEPEAQKKQFILANRLLEFDVPVKIVEYKDKTKDVGDLDKSEFIDLLGCAKVYSANYHLRRKIASITNQ